MKTTINSSPELVSNEKISQVKEMIVMRGYKPDEQPISNNKVSVKPSCVVTASSSEMLPKEFTFKAIRITKSQKATLSNMIEEAYHLRGYLLKKMYHGEDPSSLRPWLISYYSVYNGNVDVYKHIDFLDLNMIEYILEDVKRLYKLVKGNRVSNKIFLGLNTSEYKCLVLNQYGFSHNFIGSDLMRIMGLSQPLKLQWVEQLDQYKSVKYGPIKIRLIRDSIYITISCLVTPEEVKSSRQRQTLYTPQPKSSNQNYYEDFIRQSNVDGTRQKRQA